MASSEQVKHYLAYWFQLGKKLLSNEGKIINLEGLVVKGDRYSSEFENCWQEITALEGANYHLEGTDTTIKDLLTSAWNITPCARCSMPIPVLESGVQTTNCPCFDMPQWPNFELPFPRIPVQSNSRLSNINNRLKSRDTAK